MNSLRVLPVAGGQRQTDRSCAKLILAVEMECGSFVSAAKQLFGEHMALYAGILWVQRSKQIQFWLPEFQFAAGDDTRSE